MKWFRKSADQGYAAAQTELGYMYYKGEGELPQSDDLAVEWYRMSADQGHAGALGFLGFMYQQGRGGLPKSDNLAVEWYRKAADQGYVEPQQDLLAMSK